MDAGFFQQSKSNKCCFAAPLPSPDIFPNQVIQLSLVLRTSGQLGRYVFFRHTPAGINGACMHFQNVVSMSSDSANKLVFSVRARKVFQRMDFTQSWEAFCSIRTNHCVCFFLHAIFKRKRSHSLRRSSAWVRQEIFQSCVARGVTERSSSGASGMRQDHTA